MDTKQLKIIAAFLAVFLVAFYLPLGNHDVEGAIVEAFKLLQWYARNHTLACVVPALFIAGGITRRSAISLKERLEFKVGTRSAQACKRNAPKDCPSWIVS